MYSEILITTGTYTDEESRLFEEAVTSRHIVRNEFILQKGQVAKSLYFLLSGSIYQYEQVSELDRNIIDLHVENVFWKYLYSDTPGSLSVCH